MLFCIVVTKRERKKEREREQKLKHSHECSSGHLGILWTLCLDHNNIMLTPLVNMASP